MHVLWVTEAADFRGGAERHVADTATRLGERGIRSTLLYGPDCAPDPRFTNRFDAAFPWVDVGPQIADIAPDIIYVHQLRGTGPIMELAARSIPVVRFFHDHGPFCLRRHKYTAIGRHTCRRPLGIHCYPCLGFLNRGDGWSGLSLNTLARARAELAANRRFDAFITGSEYMKGHVVAHGFDPSRIHVNPLFVEPPGPEPSRPRDPGRLLFVGALLRGKGLDILLDAMGRLGPEVHLNVVGGGAQEPLFRRMRAALKLEGRVRFLGPLEAADLDRQYREAACVVAPSREPETFGLIGPEAFRHGTPVIASDAGGMGEWLRHKTTGLMFKSGDSTDLADAVREMLGNPEKARDIGSRGRG
ncbi:MAG: glycosyltransferase family 4 protein, partial [Deltaproteobacteria bacterium]|nr:glycosyltransferase family 4 protein [Deltaproteobacteria bacterium]